jgi:hypothetical protein
MNSSEFDSEWSALPDNYEVEITEGQKLTESFNDTNSNSTLTYQGMCTS